jgi:hypothetical protein
MKLLHKKFLPKKSNFPEQRIKVILGKESRGKD